MRHRATATAQLQRPRTRDSLREDTIPQWDAQGHPFPGFDAAMLLGEQGRLFASEKDRGSRDGSACAIADRPFSQIGPGAM
jgi:hypothetical protein